MSLTRRQALLIKIKELKDTIPSWNDKASKKLSTEEFTAKRRSHINKLECLDHALAENESRLMLAVADKLIEGL